MTGNVVYKSIEFDLKADLANMVLPDSSDKNIFEDFANVFVPPVFHPLVEPIAGVLTDATTGALGLGSHEKVCQKGSFFFEAHPSHC